MSEIPEEIAGVTGAVHLALDEVFSPEHLPSWLPRGAPPSRAATARLDVPA